LRGVEAKFDAFAASRAALAASGSVALELAMARLPMTVAYRLNPLTEWLLDRVLKVRQVNLINLILGRKLVGEHLGGDCNPERLATALAELIRDERVRAAHLAGYDAALRQLGAGDVSPSLKAADRILELIAARRPPDGEQPDRSAPEDARYRQVPLSAHDDPGQGPRQIAGFLHRRTRHEPDP
jgi:lipid-A-disaccharide synthase